MTLRATMVLALLATLAACALPTDALRQRVDRLLPADALLVGEQHDADAHQQLQRALVDELARRGQLAALVLEMAEQGRSTAPLQPGASEQDVRDVLQWQESGWAWARYGPVVMAAVRAGVPVLGANLARTALRPAMADARWDKHLPPAQLALQRADIRDGHCQLLPEAQVGPMARVQIARDAAMAATVRAAYQSGKTVLLVAGGAHVRRDLGVPTHLPAALRTRVLLAVAGEPDALADTATVTDMVWRTPALAPRDHCAELQRQLSR